MATSKDYLDFILGQLEYAEGITSRGMFGEYIIYCKGKVIGGIYDNRFLVKPAKAARELMPNAQEEITYPGAKPMLLADCIDDKQAMANLAEALYKGLPEPKKKCQRKN